MEATTTRSSPTTLSPKDSCSSPTTQPVPRWYREQMLNLCHEYIRMASWFKSSFSFVWRKSFVFFFKNVDEICLFVCSLSSQSRMFHWFGNVTITGEGLQILTTDRHSLSLSSEGSLACHTYCDTRHSFIMVISEDSLHSNLKPSLSVFTTYVCSGWDSNIQPSACGANALIHFVNAAVHTKLKSISM